MTALEAASDVVRGVAVVVDDKIKEPEGALASILDQIESAGLPTLLFEQLPPLETLVHWKQFGLIVLDWELSYSAAPDVQMPAGVAVPSGLSSETRAELVQFIRTLLESTALPIFIASNSDSDQIRAHLVSELADLSGYLDERVAVFSKKDLEIGLFQTLNDRIRARPSVAALRAWNRAYLDAEIETFHQFIEQSEDWVSAVFGAATFDGTSGGEALREILSRNIFSRIRPLDHGLDLAASSLADASALRRVLHLSAVVPDDSLVAGSFGTGDLFVREDAVEPYSEIRILITPDCDLVRGRKIRATYLLARLDDTHHKKQSKGRVNKVANPDRGFLASCVLTPDGLEYSIKLSEWESIWLYARGYEAGPSGEERRIPLVGSEQLQASGGHDVAAAGEDDSDSLGDGQSEEEIYAEWPGFRRIGRLMEPHLTHIQQNFSLATIRKGLPRIPDDFFN